MKINQSGDRTVATFFTSSFLLQAFCFLMQALFFSRLVLFCWLFLIVPLAVLFCQSFPILSFAMDASHGIVRDPPSAP